jgi:hypothetical protein
LIDGYAIFMQLIAQAKKGVNSQNIHDYIERKYKIVDIMRLQLHKNANESIIITE